MSIPRCIWVCGPQGAGKTTLLEDLLRSNRVRELLTIRLHRREGAARIVVNREGQYRSEDEELRRLEDAGAAYPVVKASFPSSCRADLPGHLADSFGSLELFDGVLFEGLLEQTLQCDLVVLVTRPLPADAPLVYRMRRIVAHIEVEEWLAAISSRPLPDGEKLELLEGSPLLEDEEVETLEPAEIPDEVAERLLEWSEHGVPIHREIWELDRSYVDLPKAQVVVINVADSTQRHDAERFAERLRRVYMDKEVANDVLGYASAGHPPSIYIADLADPRDAVTKKILARIKRCFPPVLTAAEEDW